MKNILVVEDTKSIREIIAFTLKNRKHNVTEAADGDRAAELIKANKYDLAILDVMLPGVTGFELAQLIRQGGSPTKILMLSAVAEGTGISDEGMKKKAGVDDYMAKPFKIQDLIAKVDVLLGSPKN